MFEPSCRDQDPSIIIQCEPSCRDPDPSIQQRDELISKYTAQFSTVTKAFYGLELFTQIFDNCPCYFCKVLTYSNYHKYLGKLQVITGFCPKLVSTSNSCYYSHRLKELCPQCFLQKLPVIFETIPTGFPKEYILVTERTAPPCVFQTFAHPTSPALSILQLPDYLTEQSPHPQFTKTWSF